MPMIDGNNQHSKISVITASLNQGRFIRQMIESVLNQTYTNYEHIIVDGGSTDKTIEILKDYPHLKWISEKDNSSGEAYLKTRSMIKGDYVIQCCTCSGFLNRDWFRICAEILDNDKDVSMVWGLPQYMREDGNLGKVSTPEYFSDPPPQKKEFLGFWLATGHIMYEGNQCTRKDVFLKCFPSGFQNWRFKENAFFDLTYNFNTLGYLPCFVPVIANYGRIHSDALGQSKLMQSRMSICYQEYLSEIGRYRKKLLNRKIKHYFRDSNSQIISELSKEELHVCKMRFYKTKIKVVLYRSLHDLLRFILRKCHLFKLRKWLETW